MNHQLPSDKQHFIWISQYSLRTNQSKPKSKTSYERKLLRPFHEMKIILTTPSCPSSAVVLSILAKFLLHQSTDLLGRGHRRRGTVLAHLFNFFTDLFDRVVNFLLQVVGKTEHWSLSAHCSCQCWTAAFLLLRAEIGPSRAGEERHCRSNANNTVEVHMTPHRNCAFEG